MGKTKHELQDEDKVTHKIKMRKHNSEEENIAERKVDNYCVKSFYGNKKNEINNHKWSIWPNKYLSNGVKTKVVKQQKFKVKRSKQTYMNCDSPISNSDNKISSSCESVATDSGLSSQSERCLERKNLRFSKTNIYGRKHSGSRFNNKNKDNIKKDTSFQSVESQTSFTSSLDSTEHSSPISSFRESPFISVADNNLDNSQESISSASKDHIPDSIELNNSLQALNNDCIENNLTNNSEKCTKEDSNDLKTKPSHDSSFKMEEGVDVKKEVKKTPQKKTLLNYFKQTDSLKKSNTSKVSSTPKQNILSPRCSSRQLILKEGRMSPSRESDVIPLFDLPESPRESLTIKRKLIKNKAEHKKKIQKKEQMYIDIGQKDFGHVTCVTCGMIYTKSQEEDEAHHAKYHQKVVPKLKFNGWKNERILQEFDDGRIIMIKDSDHQLHLKKLAEVKEMVDTELGFTSCQDLYSKAEQQAFLFISSKRIVGCAIALPIKKAYPVIPTPDAPTLEREAGVSASSWCCSTESMPALCGISRIWVFSQCRRQNIATRIVDCIRHHFLYGCVIGKHKIAFSDPTPNGRIFAEKYTGKNEILVFR